MSASASLHTIVKNTNKDFYPLSVSSVLIWLIESNISDSEYAVKGTVESRNKQTNWCRDLEKEKILRQGFPASTCHPKGLNFPVEFLNDPVWPIVLSVAAITLFDLQYLLAMRLCMAISRGRFVPVCMGRWRALALLALVFYLHGSGMMMYNNFPFTVWYSNAYYRTSGPCGLATNDAVTRLGGFPARTIPRPRPPRLGSCDPYMAINTHLLLVIKLRITWTDPLALKQWRPC